jgi:hypothetical protein
MAPRPPLPLGLAADATPRHAIGDGFVSTRRCDQNGAPGVAENCVRDAPE